jgi:hypothetical protein
MTKQFTATQLFSLVDGRLSTSMDDVYNMLNHIHGGNLFTHQLPTAMDGLRKRNPQWFQNIKDKYKEWGCTKDVDFATCISILKQHDEPFEIPQLRNEITAIAQGEQPATLPDGRYKGFYGGSLITLQHDGKEYELNTQEGIRGFANVVVEVKNGTATFEIVN